MYIRIEIYICFSGIHTKTDTMAGAANCDKPIGEEKKFPGEERWKYDKYLLDPRYGGHAFIVGSSKCTHIIYGFLPYMQKGAPLIFTDEYIDQLVSLPEPTPLLSDVDMNDEEYRAFYLVWAKMNQRDPTCLIGQYYISGMSPVPLSRQLLQLKLL